ncbi:crotonase/enoyl-CoA hydratase family protein [Pendulispora albinea]|uniref:Crotonase/enoyl-CoA hydratase family protein n=1 Tax=Pendulispora albinea TaxID=2741071 RepID=A0ABZ2M185_9BACT
MSPLVDVERRPPLLRVTIRRPEVRNAVDGPTSLALAEAFRRFEADDELSVAILTGAGGHFCAGADLKAVASGEAERLHLLEPPTDDALGHGPMGPTRFRLSKPVIAAVSGYCVAGGLELALWCDLRVADESAVFGVFCRRFGVPLIDGGTVRLPRAIGMSRALDMILTGRAVGAREAFEIGLVNRLVSDVMVEAEQLALQLAAFPQRCMRGDRLSAYEQWGLSPHAALENEFSKGMDSLSAGEALSGATRFTRGTGRHGTFE